MNSIESPRLGTILNAFPGRRVAVFGDLMLDRYVWGSVERISPEAPVPVLDVREESVRFGGAANVAENVVSLGGSALLVGAVGEDDGGRELLSLLRTRGVDASRVVSVPGRVTTTKTRLIAHSQQIVRADREDAREVGPPHDAAIRDGLESAIDACDVLVISDYGKGVVTQASLAAALSAALSKGRKVCVDPKESHFPSYRRVTAITPNQKEAGNAVGVRITDDESLARVGWELQRSLDAACVVITRGEHGMSLFLKGGERVDLPTVAREVFDVTGAGDTVVSAMAVSLAAGATMVEAAIIANHAAGVVIREVGTASATVDEIARSFAELREGTGGARRRA
ncbi:MAG: D-glycero-beta-D-manno-heptose-7-phosphate kinase [Candidatus Eisenbacteria bacterium]|nr:D-glycero-beta-D-manno-heptose-7-phosphate kinase [Candidatus Eisenbacteria bacterium]